MEKQPVINQAAQTTSVDGIPGNRKAEAKQDISQERKSLITRLLSVPMLADITTVVVSVLAGVGIAVTWLESSVNTRIEKRVVPFESYMQGVSFVVNEDFDRAVPLLEKAYNEIGGTLDYKTTSAEERYPVIEHYLAALANSENPEDYLHRMNAIVQQEATKITLSPWANMHAGWFYIRVGDPLKARERLIRATTEFDVKKVYMDSAFCYYALMLLDLADGNADAAYLNAQEAANRNRSKYGLLIIKSDLKAFPNEGWFQKLAIRYPRLQETMVLLGQRL
jgi:tetratricopeptide (TPR) repeat protein